MALKAPGRRARREDARAGWLFTLPVIAVLGLFLLVPVLMALWVSFSDWTGRGSPLAPGVGFVGFDNYAAITSGGGLAERNFGIALRNNAWYVLLVVPLQTGLSLLLAVLVNRAVLRGRGLFRTAFYFPSVTSSVAITVLWLFLFSTSGAVNQVLGWIGLNGPNWFNDPRGIVHVALGGGNGPAFLTGSDFLGVTWWDWLSGPSVAMSALVLMAVFTTSGTFMLLFLAALQNIGPELDEAGRMDGATAWQRFWRITLPQLRPALFTVLTLGLIGCWQVFDQIYTGTQGGPGKTTVTPAYLSYEAAFTDQAWGQGAAISFVLFAIIVVFTVFQRWALRERDTSKRVARRLAKEARA
ncbi:carbohydrate ABC transporter permease [Glycomyces artemisiae]|uniref:Carbohydrate ABC transporter membrane protein 1 (CUT1 family) n=1 Tax=Glycomyces artemisiae TaxID=1076443 RepID=A0A2T0URP4_9ACTN|nr:sugar ABC transporter permease [Glycomyces artemisiae]PRY60584.1 carbohydrate ABC transporter membrane protein 1 (CUT1 family) [Glycomyces artemisiae]